MPAGVFDIDRLMETAGQVDLTDIAWSDVPRYPLTPETTRTLRVFAGVEASTLLYAKTLLNLKSALREPFGPFLAAWVFEEEFHGRAFRRFLEAAGDRIPDRLERQNIFENRSRTEVFQEVMGHLFDFAFPDDWPAVHMTWGAVQEFTTYTCYQRLAARAQHPILSTICDRIMKQELRHFTFYYQQAEQHLQRRSAQRLTEFALRVGWTPVGDGVVSRPEICHAIRYLLDGRDGDAVARIERRVRQLPGLGWFDLFTRFVRRYDLRAPPREWFPVRTGARAIIEA